MTTMTTTVYSRLSDQELERELHALAIRVAVFKDATTPAGIRLFNEFTKRRDEARLEASRRAAI